MDRVHAKVEGAATWRSRGQDGIGPQENKDVAKMKRKELQRQEDAYYDVFFVGTPVPRDLENFEAWEHGAWAQGLQGSLARPKVKTMETRRHMEPVRSFKDVSWLFKPFGCN